MNTTFRYFVVTVAALLLLLGPMAWAYQFKQMFRAKYAKIARDFAVSQGDTAAAKVSDAEILKEGFGTEIDPGEMNRLLISDILLTYWWVWGLFVLGLCWLLFLVLGRFRSPVAP